MAIPSAAPVPTRLPPPMMPPSPGGTWSGTASGIPLGSTSGSQAPPSTPGPLAGPGIGETYGASHLDQYNSPTMLEQFAGSQMNGNNPYYQRLQQQQNDTINQQMAARGHYNSGGALSALGNADAALNAAQFKDMGDLAGAASSMGLNRLGSGIGAAAGIQGLGQGREQQQFSNLSDMAHLGAGLYGGFYGQGGAQSGDAAMAGINAGANAASLGGQQTNAQSAYAMNMFKMMMGGGGGGAGGVMGNMGNGGGQTNYGNGLMKPTQF